jgi:hypothetical protein
MAFCTSPTDDLPSHDNLYARGHRKGANFRHGGLVVPVLLQFVTIILPKKFINHVASGSEY